MRVRDGATTTPTLSELWHQTCRPRSGPAAAWTGCSSLRGDPVTRQESVQKQLATVLTHVEKIRVVCRETVQVYQQVQDPGGQGFEAREAQSQVLQQTDQNFHPEQQ